jgi:hypothetical protein
MICINSGSGAAIHDGSSVSFILCEIFLSALAQWRKEGHTPHTMGGTIVFFLLAAYPRVQIQGCHDAYDPR